MTATTIEDIEAKFQRGEISQAEYRRLKNENEPQEEKPKVPITAVIDENTFTGSTKDFAEVMGLSYQEALGAVTFLESVGAIQKAGYSQNKGRKAVTWKIPLNLTVKLEPKKPE